MHQGNLFFFIVNSQTRLGPVPVHSFVVATVKDFFLDSFIKSAKCASKRTRFG